jgi:hypothetical protein
MFWGTPFEGTAGLLRKDRKRVTISPHERPKGDFLKGRKA